MSTIDSDEINLVHFFGGLFSINLVWKENGLPLDLTSKVIEIYNVVPQALYADFSVTITDAVNGKFSVSAPSTVNWPTTLGPVVSFRIRIAGGESLPIFKVYVK